MAPIRIDYDGTFVRRVQEPTDGSEALDTTLYYDAAGALVRVDEQATEGIATSTYEYDGNRKLKKIVDADAVVSTYEHDLLGRRTQIRRVNRVWLYSYDRNGNLIREQAPAPWPQPPGIAVADFVSTFTYDALDRQTSIRAGRGFLAVTSIPGVHETHGITYLDYDTNCDGASWNAPGNLCRVRSPIGTITYRYDAENRVSSERRDLSINIGDAAPIEIDEKLSLAYNAMGAPLEQRHERGNNVSLIRHDYDSNADPWTVGAAFSTTGTPGTPTTLATLTRSYTGVLRSRRSPGTSFQSWAYDDVGRVTENTVSRAATVRAGENATYYSNGNVQALLDRASGVTFDYAYDPQHQLIGVSSSDPALYAASFAYSKNGRLTDVYIGSSNETTDVFPRDVYYYYPNGFEAPFGIYDKASGAPVVRLTYDDAAGNIIRRTAAGRTLRFWHDALDQTRAVEQEGTSTRDVYIYDHTGNRIAAYSTARGNEPARLRHWFGAAETAYTPASAVEKHDLFVALEGQPVARIENGDVAGAKLLFSNVLGHLLAALDQQGNVLAQFTYGPFGEILQTAGSHVETYRRRFNGKELDAFTDLAYYGFRYYDRLTMMWTQPDPLFRAAPDTLLESPRDASLYTFVANNPLRFVDPNGLERGMLNSQAANDMCSAKGGCSSHAEWEHLWEMAGGGYPQDAEKRLAVMAIGVGLVLNAPATLTIVFAGMGDGEGAGLMGAGCHVACSAVVKTAGAAGAVDDVGTATMNLTDDLAKAADDIIASPADDVSRSIDDAIAPAEAPTPGDARQVWTATDDGIVHAPNTDVNAVPTAAPNPRAPQWGQVHGSHPHRGDVRVHAHGPAPGTGRRIDAIVEDTMRRIDAGLKNGSLRLRRDRGDRGGP